MPKVNGATGGKRSDGLQRLPGIRFFVVKGFRLVAYARKPRGFPLNSKLAVFPMKRFSSSLPNREVQCTCVCTRTSTYEPVRLKSASWKVAGKPVAYSYSHKFQFCGPVFKSFLAQTISPEAAGCGRQSHARRASEHKDPSKKAAG